MLYRRHMPLQSCPGLCLGRPSPNADIELRSEPLGTALIKPCREAYLMMGRAMAAYGCVVFFLRIRPGSGGGKVGTIIAIAYHMPSRFFVFRYWPA